MFSFLDSQNVPVAKPDRTVDVKVFDLGADPKKAVAEGPATFIWAIEPQVGVYVIDLDLPTAGDYGVEFTTTPAGGTAETIRTTMEVQPSSSVIAVGDKAPASDTPTLDDVGGDISKISTDPKPDPAFYTTSIADAVAAKKPFVVAFATPKFCVSKQCGPTLDRLKPIAAKHPGVTVINVEPYQLQYADGALQPVLDASGHLTPTKATDEWHLPTEPWVFVVDKDGVVQGLVHADLQRRGARHGDGRGRVAPPRPPAPADGAGRRVLQPERASRSSPSTRNHTRTGSAVAWCSARWPGGNWFPFGARGD